MPIAFARSALWALFGTLLVACGLVLLFACEFAIGPLFGLRYCILPEAIDALAMERARGRDLEARIREAELRLAEKPLCPPPRRGEPDVPTKKQEPQKGEEPQRGEEPLKIPEKISDLEGCWESVRGDLPVVTNDAEEKVVGNVRKCYCFGSRGAGRVKVLYTNGVKCLGRIKARIDGGTLKIHRPRFDCHHNGQEWGLVAADIVCHSADNDTALCDTKTHGQRPSSSDGDSYRRVEQAHCD